MDHHPLASTLRRLYRSATHDESQAPTDAQLLERFTAGRDESAFEALVNRHGRIVWSVCRRLLRREQDAEDAFQATFLLLVRRAGSIGRREAVAAWLYRVACRVALRLRAQAARRAVRDQQAARPLAMETEGETLWRDLRPVLDEEVSRLPEKYRLPVILCYLSGHTTEEAARRLGCPRGTVLSRLAWARQRLRGRLARRGLAVSVGALAAVLAEKASAVPPGDVLWRTLTAARWLAAGQAAVPGAVSVRAVALMEGVLRAMYWTRMRTITAMVSLLVLGAAAGFWAYRPVEAGGLSTTKNEATPSASAATPALSARASALGLAGTWVRTVGPYQLTLRIEGERLHGTFVGPLDNPDGERVTIFLDADYSISKDGTLYGLVTGIDLPDGDPEDADELVSVVDEPFSARLRVDEDVLVLKEIKFRTGENNNQLKDLRLLMGRYKKAPPGSKVNADDGAPRPTRSRRGGRIRNSPVAPPAVGPVPAPIINGPAVPSIPGNLPPAPAPSY